jgi:chitin disaccharide deacetylase
MKRLILCADDYGQNSAISQAIVELLREKRLSATSCLVTAPGWKDQAKWLEPLKNTADIGLHFNLTQGKPLSSQLPAFFPLKDLIINSNFKELDKKQIGAELRAQLEQFTNVFGQLPDFIDGHQHVHQFPIIRDVIFEIYEESLRANGSYVRCTFGTNRDFLNVRDVAYIKSLIIQLCGGIKFKAECIKRKIPHNSSFAGIYDFSNSIEYPQYFPRFLKQIQDGGLLMCHPGLLSAEESEVIAGARHNEYIYYSGQKFMKDMYSNEINLVRFNYLK